MRNAIALMLGLTGCAAGHASTFNISPIRAQLGGAHPTDVLTMMNPDDLPVVVQVRVVSWSQSGGEERLEDTRDVLVTPPVMQIGANREQIVRVALRRAPDTTRELTYRVIFEEVPQAAAAEFNGLRVALRLSVPVFVAPADLHGAPDVVWAAQWRADGKLDISATNRGSAHLQVTDFDVEAGGSTLRGVTSKYILPGSRMNWTLTPGDAFPHQGPLRIHGRSDQGEFSADAAANGS
jgi:fimbrial chaperone protein